MPARMQRTPSPLRLCVILVGRGLAPAVATNTLSAPSVCHPEQAKRVEPQAKRRGGCRVSGRRDLSWSYGCFCLDPTSRYPHRCCYAVRLRAYRPPLRMTHRRYIFVTHPRAIRESPLRLDRIKTERHNKQREQARIEKERPKSLFSFMPKMQF